MSLSNNHLAAIIRYPVKKELTNLFLFEMVVIDCLMSSLLLLLEILPRTATPEWRQSKPISPYIIASTGQIAITMIINAIEVVIT